MAGMSDAAWQVTERLARAAGLGDAQLAGLAVGCPAHGNAHMDFDDAGVFCHECERPERLCLCRACLADEWDGMSEYPSNPDAGECANCGGDHAVLSGGCCGRCFAAGYREACDRPHR